ncbi:hypothetical protein CCMA1212_006849 [Trichoderma ghanense]|uniref:Uncharacterized protein n=1 Tax=Trichoderma ghanense TaxID=65468 RepID=A0ABY2H0E2_9HYPO
MSPLPRQPSRPAPVLFGGHLAATIGCSCPGRPRVTPPCDGALAQAQVFLPARLLVSPLRSSSLFLLTGSSVSQDPPPEQTKDFVGKVLSIHSLNQTHLLDIDCPFIAHYTLTFFCTTHNNKAHTIRRLSRIPCQVSRSRPANHRRYSPSCLILPPYLHPPPSPTSSHASLRDAGTIARAQTCTKDANTHPKASKMKFSLFAIAALPALALAQSTTTETSTTVLTKTVTLKKLHTVTSISSSLNATTTHAAATASSNHHLIGTGVTTTYYQPTAPPSTGAPVASATATKGPQNAGVALEASKVALAGVAGMIVVALM